MLVKIANPIYDTVFKYMLEDDRVARILLSALLFIYRTTYPSMHHNKRWEISQRVTDVNMFFNIL